MTVGDLVLVLYNNFPQNQWKKDVITRVFPGSDDQVRVVEVRTSSGTFLRSSRKLVRFTVVQTPWGYIRCMDEERRISPYTDHVLAVKASRYDVVPLSYRYIGIINVKFHQENMI